MKKLAFALAIIAGALFATAPAEARYVGHGYYSSLAYWKHRRAAHRHYASRHRHHVGTRRALVHRGGGGKPSCFWTAASQGGPCGCWAEAAILGRVEHVLRDALGTWNPWLADDWRRHFPHVSPEVADAAVWPGRHVSPVVPGTYRNGTIVVRDSWATHRVRTAGLVFVAVPGRKERRPSVRFASGSLG